MLVKLFSKVTVAVAIASLLSPAAWGQAAEQQASPWKDRAEYDLYNSIVNEKDSSKKLQLLDSWKEKYPGTQFQEARLLLYTQTYQALNQVPKVYASALDLLKVNPKNITALYYITSLTVSTGDTSPERLANGEKGAKALMENVKAMQKPENVSEADFKKQVEALELTIHTTLGWVAMNRKANEEAEREFREVLRLNPTNGQVSYWLGTVIIAQRVPEKQFEAFFYFARATGYTGEGEMSEAGRKQVGDYLRKIYTSYHGDESGLDEFIAMARKSATPPPGLRIKSAAEIQAEKEEQFRRENPQLALWLTIKEQLEAPDGEQYFAQSMKNTALPRLRGWLISADPPTRPTELVLGLSNRNTPEVTLKLDTPYRYGAPRGTVLQFQGVPQEFRKQPFRVIIEVDRDNIQGWPQPPSRKTTKES